jgi:photosystem II stability/assembly factor-like uncharacterized protein
MKTKLLLCISLIASGLFVKAQWTNQNSGVTNDLRTIYFLDNNNGFAAGNGGVLRRTINGGTNWSAVVSTTTWDIYGMHFPTASVGYLCARNGTVVKTTNGGTSWTNSPTPITNDLLAIYFMDANTGIAVGRGGAMIGTVNGGSNWTSLTSGTTQDLYSVWFTSSTTGYACGTNGTFLKTTNAGLTWTPQTSGLPNDTLKSLYFTSPTMGFVTASGGNVLTTDGAGVFTSINPPTTKSVNDSWWINDSTGWVVGDSGNIFTTQDTGITWTQQTSLTTQRLYAVCFPTDTVGYACGKGGIIRKLIVVSPGPNPGFGEIPKNNLSIHAYPNPATQGNYLTVTFEGKPGTETVITMLDLMGKEVYSGQPVKTTSGKNQVRIPIGADISSGSYFLKVKSGNEVNYKKVQIQ